MGGLAVRTGVCDGLQGAHSVVEYIIFISNLLKNSLFYRKRGEIEEKIKHCRRKLRNTETPLEKRL